MYAGAEVWYNIKDINFEKIELIPHRIPEYIFLYSKDFGWMSIWNLESSAFYKIKIYL